MFLRMFIVFLSFCCWLYSPELPRPDSYDARSQGNDNPEEKGVDLPLGQPDSAQTGHPVGFVSVSNFARIFAIGELRDLHDPAFAVEIWGGEEPPFAEGPPGKLNCEDLSFAFPKIDYRRRQLPAWQPLRVSVRARKGNVGGRVRLKILGSRHQASREVDRSPRKQAFGINLQHNFKSTSERVRSQTSVAYPVQRP